MRRRTVDYLEAVTVCVGYDDFLAETIRYNLPLFDRYIVVTHPDDQLTREVCRRWNVECLLSDDAKRHSDNRLGFNKGRLIERALMQLTGQGWRLHIDADIALPHRFRQQLEIAELDHDKIYGIDRIMLRSRSEWERVKQSQYLLGGQWDYHCRATFLDNYPIGTRWVHPTFGYCPIGYFQLFHSSQDEWRGIRVKTYPLEHSTACRTDVQFAMKWDRNKRAVIPEVMGIHIESEKVEKGANWKGRTTKRLNGPESAVRDLGCSG